MAIDGYTKQMRKAVKLFVLRRVADRKQSEGELAPLAAEIYADTKLHEIITGHSGSWSKVSQQWSIGCKPYPNQSKIYKSIEALVKPRDHKDNNARKSKKRKLELVAETGEQAIERGAKRKSREGELSAGHFGGLEALQQAAALGATNNGDAPAQPSVEQKAAAYRFAEHGGKCSISQKCIRRFHVLLVNAANNNGGVVPAARQLAPPPPPPPPLDPTKLAELFTVHRAAMRHGRAARLAAAFQL
jgi:hypothetical protein